MRLLPDLAPARENPAYRRLLIGGNLSSIGSSMTAFAVTLQVWDISRSSFAVGALGFTFIPALFVGLIGGSVADKVDRRRLVLIMSSCLAAVSALFAAQAFAGSRLLWPLYLLIMIQSVLAAISSPASRTFMPWLLPKGQLRAGIALSTLSGRVTMLAGPALAGVVAGAWGVKVCYAIDVVSFAAALYATARLPVMRAAVTATASTRTLHSIAEGLRYIRRSPVLLASFLTDFDAMLLGLPVALFPALNAEHFGGRPQTLGLLTTAVGVGGLCSAVLSGSAARVRRQGWGMLAGTMLWGAAIAGFGLARSLPLALGMLAIAGAADTLTVTFRSSMVQLITPDEFRGRVNSVEYIIGAGGSPIGSVEAGAVAALTSPVFSAVSGGFGCVAVAAVIGLAFPAFRRYQGHVAAEPRPTAAAASAS
jgi:MFS family permease